MAELRRLEDFIALAKAGKEVKVDVKLRKEIVIQKIHPQATEEMKSEIDMYLLIADYNFKADSDTAIVSKIYMHGSAGESLSDAKIAVNIANARLKMDYERLKSAGIEFEEKYFE